ncbi:DUF7408 domain-containing protein [Planifilum fimeticola]
MRRRRGYLKGLLLLLVLFLGFPGMAAGAPGQLRLEVSPGYDGVYKGDWVPVRVKISNTGGDIEGELVVRSEQIPATAPESRLFVAESVKVAGGTSKEVTLLLSEPGFLADATIQFRTDGRVLAREKIGGEKVSDSELLIGVLSHSPILSSHINRWVGTADAPPARVQLVKAEEIPEKDAGLSGLDVLVVNGIDLGSLGSSRQKAIRRWVEKGGLLVLAGGPSFDSTLGDWKSMLPVKVEGKTTLKNLKPFSRWGKVPDLDSPLPVSRTRLADGGRSVIAAGDLPLLARRPVGTGAVVYAAYDLTAAPLAEWDGNERLWREMLILGGGEGSSLRSTLALDPILEQAILLMPHLRLPSLPAVAALFLAYALAIGPITYWILSRMNRREWAWWIIPSLGIAIALGIYTYGKVVRGDDVLVHNLAYVEAKNSGEARVLGVSGFITQEAGAYRLEGSPDMWMWPLFHGERNRSEVEVSGRPSVTFRSVPHWTLRKVIVETTKSLDGELRAVARYVDGTLRGEVTNGTRLPLRDVTVDLGNRRHRVGSLAPGETRDFEISYVPDRDGRARDDFMPEPMPAGDRDLTREDLMRPVGTGIRVTGWTEAPVFSYDVRGHKTEAENLAQVSGRVEVMPRQKGESILWPRGTVPARPLGGRSSMLRLSGGMVAEEEWKDPVLVAYDLPSAPSGWKPLRIDFAPEGDVEVYDWRRGKWVKASLLPEEPSGDLSSFVSSFGRVVVRMEQAGSYPSLEVEGRVVR